MKNISEILENVKTVGIGGHIRPDGGQIAFQFSFKNCCHD